MVILQLNEALYILKTRYLITLVYSENSTFYRYDSIMTGDINVLIKLIKLSVT